MARVYLDSFSGDAAGLPKHLRNSDGVLAALKKNPRVSAWDMSEHNYLRTAILDLKKRGLIEEIPAAFPWHKYKVTESPSIGLE